MRNDAIRRKKRLKEYEIQSEIDNARVMAEETNEWSYTAWADALQRREPLALAILEQTLNESPA